MHNPHPEYVGFWLRVVASLIDTLLALVILTPVLVWLYGWAYFDSESVVTGPLDFLLTWVLPAAVTIWFWVRFGGQTPGKMAVGAKIVDVDTGEPITVGKGVLRYLGYFVSTLVFMLGFIWVALDSRKRGWHDYIAGTVVVRK